MPYADVYRDICEHANIEFIYHLSHQLSSIILMRAYTITLTGIYMLAYMCILQWCKRDLVVRDRDVCFSVRDETETFPHFHETETFIFTSKTRPRSRPHKSKIETFFETKLQHFCIIRPTLIVLFWFYDFETITASHWLAKTSLEAARQR